MAVALDTVTETSWVGRAGGDPYTANLPAGLAVGDLIIIGVFAVEVDSSTINSIYPTSSSWSGEGWTYLGGTTSGTSVSALYAKVADSDDVSAGTISLTPSTSASGDVWMKTVAVSVTGYGGISSIQLASGSVASTANLSFATGTTQTFTDSLLLFWVFAVDTGITSTTTSGYAITGDNPTWTERVDSYGDSNPYAGPDNDALLALATASRSAASALGTASATLSQAWDAIIGRILIIPPVTNATVNAGVVSMTSSPQSVSVTGGANASPSVISVTSSVQAPAVSAGDSKWNNVDKSSASPITNTPKS